jgi:hypothetical protein
MISNFEDASCNPKLNNQCRLLYIQEPINGIHITIIKHVAFANDYYYFKTKVYNIVSQTIIGCNSKITNVFVGLLGFMNGYCKYVCNIT